MHRPLLSIIAASWLAIGLLRAQTFVVDAAGGAGAQFTSIAAAIGAVPSGSTLIVRAGTYQPFVVDAKSVHVLADVGVSISGTVFVQSTAAGQAVTLSGMTFSPPTPGENTILGVQGCAGLVIVANVTTPPSLAATPIIPGLYFYPTALSIGDSGQVVVRSSTLAQVIAVSSRVVIEASVVRGNDAIVSAPSEALFLTSSDVEIVGDTLIAGGDSPPGATGGVGMLVTNSTVNVRGGQVRSGAGTANLAALVLSGAISIDPDVILTGSTSPVFGGVSFVDLAEVTTSGAAPGGTMTAQVRSEPGDLVALFAGPPGLPLPVPAIAATVWADLAGIALQVLAVQSATPLTHSIQVPGVAALRGVPVVWQAVTLGARGIVGANPSLALVE